MDQSDIPVFMPHLGADTLKAVSDAFDIGWIGMGATTAAFEEALQSHLGTDRHVVATMTGTAAIHLGLLLAGVGPGDEVILPSFTYIADVQAVVMTGAKPVFCDIGEDSYSLDLNRVQELITSRTRAVLPLHFAGIVGDLDGLYELASQHRLRVVEDATHALGSHHEGRAIGSFGDIACFSFDPVKIITSLDGGAVVCRRDEDISRLHRWRLLGVDKDTSLRYRNQRAWDYDVTGLGFRAHMTNINAAIGLSQLRRFNEFLVNRRQDCKAYVRAFNSLPFVRVPDVTWDTIGPFIFTVRVTEGSREAFMAHLRSHGVASGIHFLPCHRMTYCEPYSRGSMDVTDRVSASIVTLPLWSNMPRNTRDRVIASVESYEPAHASAPASTCV